MRIYDSARSLISEMGRDLIEMGLTLKPLSYQNKDISDNPDYWTKDIAMKSYCLVELPDPDNLFVYTKSKDWAEAEFEERIKNTDFNHNPGKAWKLRREVWEQFLNKQDEFDYTYNERMSGQIDVVIRELKRNPDTRQAIIQIYDNHDTLYYIGGKRRVPCSLNYQFLIRPGANGNPELHIVYNQRSCDFITHFGNDCYLAWKLKEYVADKLGIKGGHLYHNITSLHVYNKDWHILKDSIDNHII